MAAFYRVFDRKTHIALLVVLFVCLLGSTPSSAFASECDGDEELVFYASSSWHEDEMSAYDELEELIEEDVKDNVDIYEQEGFSLNSVSVQCSLEVKNFSNGSVSEKQYRALGEVELMFVCLGSESIIYEKFVSAEFSCQ